MLRRFGASALITAVAGQQQPQSSKGADKSTVLTKRGISAIMARILKDPRKESKTATVPHLPPRHARENKKRERARGAKVTVANQTPLTLPEKEADVSAVSANRSTKIPQTSKQPKKAKPAKHRKQTLRKRGGAAGASQGLASTSTPPADAVATKASSGPSKPKTTAVTPQKAFKHETSPKTSQRSSKSSPPTPSTPSAPTVTTQRRGRPKKGLSARIPSSSVVATAASPPATAMMDSVLRVIAADDAAPKPKKTKTAKKKATKRRKPAGKLATAAAKRRSNGVKKARAPPPPLAGTTPAMSAAGLSPALAKTGVAPGAAAAADITREREVAMLRAEEVILRGMIRDARGALYEAKRRDRDIMLMAREPWRVVTGGPALRFTPSALKRDVAAAIKALPNGPGRAEATKRVGKIVPSEWKAAAKMNAAIRAKLEATLAVDSEEKPDPFLLERLKAQPWFTGERVVRDAAAGVDRLKEAAKHGGKTAGQARRSEASQRLRREWFAMNEAIANHGHAGSAAARELMSLTDYVGGLGVAPPGGKD